MQKASGKTDEKSLGEDASACPGKRKRELGASDLGKLCRGTGPTQSSSKTGGNIAPKFGIDKTGGQVIIGNCISPNKRPSKGTVGPFVRIKESGTLCFLTTRHIFGPLTKYDDEVIGTEIAFNSDTSGLMGNVCGKVIASEYSDTLGAALIKIDRNWLPDRCRFIDVTEDQLVAAGFNKFNKPKYDGVHKLLDVRDLNPQDVQIKRVIKFGCASGLTVGTLSMKDKEGVKPDNYVITCNYPKLRKTEVVSYNNHILVKSLEQGSFAKAEDAGASIFLVDEHNQLHCIGMLCRLLDNDTDVVVAPIQLILEKLGKQLGQTLEIATFDDGLYSESSDPCFRQAFENALLKGQEKDRHLRINVVGFYAEGKTTLTKRLLNEPLDDINCTDGIDVRVRTCKMKGRHWETYASEHIEEEFPRRLADVIRTEETEEAIIYNRTPVDISQKNTESLRMGAVHKKTLAPPNRKTAQKSSDVTRSRYIPQIPSKTQHLMRKTLKHLRKDDSVLREDELLATFWDFGGQFIYYATHQIFHSRDAIYLLVFDLTKNLEDVIIDYDFPDRKEKMKNSLLFWANSIEAFAGNNEDHKPTIILVGTHRDEFTGDIDQKFEEVICLFSDTTVKNHIYEKWFAIAAMDMDDIQIDALRETIFKIGKESAGKRKLPAKWIPLENAILEVRHKDILKFQNIIELDETNDFPIRDENEIKDFLKYHHGKGTLVYFDEVGLKDFVVINPQFLINAFRCIITPKLFCRWNFTLEPELKKVTKSAILGKEFLTSIWSNAKIRNCKHHKDTLLLFLERHRILAEMLKMDEATGKVLPLGKYLIPIMLKTPSVYSKKVINLFLDGKQCSKIILGLEFKSDVILSTVYEKVTAACLGKWPPIEYKGERLVFKNICFYEIDPSHAGMVVVKDKAIELTGIYLCSKTEDDGTACDYFRRYIEMVISEEFQKFYESKSDDQYNKYLRCNHSEHNGIGSRGVRYIEPLKNCGTVSCPDFSNHPFEFRTAMKEWFLEQNLSKMHVSLMRRLTEQDLNKIAQAIGDNWQLLGISLGLTSDELQHVKYDTQNEGLATSIFYMLNKWKQKYPEKDNVQFLKNVMEESSEAVSINWDKIRNILDFDIHK